MENNIKPVLLLGFLKRNNQVAPVLSCPLNLLRIYLNPDPVGPFAQVPFPLPRFSRPQGRRPGRALQAGGPPEPQKDRPAKDPGSARLRGHVDQDD